MPSGGLGLPVRQWLAEHQGWFRLTALPPHPSQQLQPLEGGPKAASSTDHLVRDTSEQTHLLLQWQGSPSDWEERKCPKMKRTQLRDEDAVWQGIVV